jgi:glycosyltransferase involved in cell wall biosynthesis
MIVKNEEANIKAALDWARDICIEQIVVDTGSTDRTVEIAESLGAKVLHFDWCDDFAKAKNFAIDAASGTWISFFDADETLTPADAAKVIPLIEKAGRDTNYKCAVLNTQIIDLNDKGDIIITRVIGRLFRNIPDIRYIGRVHEHININTDMYDIKTTYEITARHTGYSESAYADGSKIERNLKLLRLDLAEKPDDIIVKAYLMESLLVTKKPEDTAEAIIYAREVAVTPLPYDYEKLRRSAIITLCIEYSGSEETEDDALYYSKLGYELYPECADLVYLRGVFLLLSDATAEAQKLLNKAEDMLRADTLATESVVLVKDVFKLFFYQMQCAQKLNDLPRIMHYATLMLRQDKYQKGIIRPYMHTLLSTGTGVTEVLELLMKLYGIAPGLPVTQESLRDKLFLIAAAKDITGNPQAVPESSDLLKALRDLISAEDLAYLKGGDNESEI